MSATVDETEGVERRRTFLESVLARREFGVVVAVLGLLIVGVIVNARVFLTLGNMFGVLRNAAVVTIIGYGMTMLITAGEFDLSVGSVMAVAAGMTAIMLGDGFGIVFTLAVVALFAVLFGIGQGLLVTKLDLPSLIVTIGTLTLLRGAHLIITGNVTQTVPSRTMPLFLWSLGGTLRLPFTVFVPFTDVSLFTIPPIRYTVPFVHDSQRVFDSFGLQIFWVLILLVVFHYLLFYTRFGYRSMATGGDESASRNVGVKTDQIKIANFALVALLAAFAGVGQLAFTGNVSPLTGQGQELVVIAAVVIGGTNLFGGEGTMIGTVLGALVFAFTQNILVLEGLGTQLFAVFTGVFIIFAVGVDALSRKTRYDTFTRAFLDPLRDVVAGPRAFFEDVEENVQGIDSPLAFLAMATLAWSIPALVVVLLTFVDNPLTGSAFIPGGFSVFIVDGNGAALGTMPLFAFSLTGVVGLLSVVFLHATVRALGGAGGVDETVQTVGFALAPICLFVVPFLLEGFNFLDVVVIAALAPLILAAGYLAYVGVEVLHELESLRSGAAVVGAGLLWLLTVWAVVAATPVP